MMEFYVVLIGALLSAGLLYMGRGFLAWVCTIACLLGAWYLAAGASLLFYVAAGVALALAGLFGLRPLRRMSVSKPLMRWVGGILPTMLEMTEEKMIVFKFKGIQ